MHNMIIMKVLAENKDTLTGNFRYVRSSLVKPHLPDNAFSLEIEFKHADGRIFYDYLASHRYEIRTWADLTKLNEYVVSLGVKISRIEVVNN